MNVYTSFNVHISTAFLYLKYDTVSPRVDENWRRADIVRVEKENDGEALQLFYFALAFGGIPSS